MRVCVIGNSHAACIKSGWESIAAEFPDHALTFFAAIRSQLSGLVVQDGRLVPETDALRQQLAFTSGGREAIDPADYDVFVLVALGLIVPWGESWERLSTGVLRHLVAPATDCLASELGRRIRGVTEHPVLLLPEPVAAADEAVLSVDTVREYPRVIDSMSSAVAIPGARVLPQPVETLAHGWRTEPQWSAGSVGLEQAGRAARQHEDVDRAHMNAQFGALWLRNILPVLGERTSAEA